MTLQLDLDLSLELDTAVEPSPHVLRAAGMFGLGVDQRRRLGIIPPLRLRLSERRIIFITGPSGSGKSCLLGLIEQALAGRPEARVLRLDRLPELPDRPLVDCLSTPTLEQTLALLSLTGLSDAFVMLRRPSQLSDGQRYRLRLAQVLALIRAGPGEVLPVILADDFAATLDRPTAMVLARNLRRWTRRAHDPTNPQFPGAGELPGACFIVATTHDDLLEALEPDVLIEKHLGTGLELVSAEEVQR